VTEPLPLPVAPALIVIQLALLVAVQPQPVGAVTATVPLPATDVTLADGAAIVAVQGTPAWVTVKVLPPTVSVPVRAVVVGLAATL
jgi:hypothetical protein